MPPRISFQHGPAGVTIGEGLTTAARYWGASVERWVLAVAAVGLVNGLVTWLFLDSLLDQAALNRLMVQLVNEEPVDPVVLPRLVAASLATTIVTLVAGWFLAANAIAGLRDREVSAPWVVTAGLRSVVGVLLVAMTLVLMFSTAAALRAVGILAFIALLPVGWYVLIRLSFWTLAIFDGNGIAAGAAASWALTRRAVLRTVGWSLLLFALSIGVFIAGIIVDALLAGVPALSAAVQATIDTALAAYTGIVLAVLYESQRARRLPVATPQPEARSPLDPPPPPPGY